MTLDVAVVGAGVSGLTVAYELRRRGQRVAVLERQARAGGNAISERIDGFLMEHGPSSLAASAPDAAALSRALGLDRLRCELGPNVRARYLVDGSGLHGIPTHPFGFIVSNYLSVGARLRLAAEAFVPAKFEHGEESVAQFWSRRFGAEFADRVIDPLVGGLFAGRAAALSMPAVFPRLLDMERRHGSITRGALAHSRGGARMPGRRLYSWRDGVGSLPCALGRSLGGAVRTGVAVRRIRPRPGGFRIEAGTAGAVEARAVVVATQPHVAAALLDGLDDDAARAASVIEAPPLATVFLGYRREDVSHPLDGLGYLTPSRGGRAMSGALFCSTMFSGRAPAGHVAVAGYIGGARAPDLARLASAELIALARQEFRDLLGATGAPVVARVRQWPRGLPQYTLGHLDRVAALRELEQRRPGVFVTGNYLTGPSVAACVTEASRVAGRVDGFLAERELRNIVGHSSAAPGALRA